MTKTKSYGVAVFFSQLDLGFKFTASRDADILLPCDTLSSFADGLFHQVDEHFLFYGFLDELLASYSWHHGQNLLR